MKKLIYPIAAVLIFTSSAFISMNSTSDYKFKEGFTIAFKSKDPSGEFKKASGNITFDENNLGDSKFEITIDVSSITTGNAMQNKKAQIAEWFDSKKYPTIKFVSTKVEKSGDDYAVTGNLTIKGTTKTKKVPVKVTKSGNDLKFEGKFGVNRMDYGVGHTSDAVPEVMNINYSIPVTKK